MHAEPADLSRDLVRAALREGWGLDDASLTYLPVGFGTHHYQAESPDGRPWFVNVDDLTAKSWLSTAPDAAFDGLARALRTAGTLREAGLAFVVTPLTSGGGIPLLRLDGRYAVSVYPFVDGESSPWGDFRSEALRREACQRVRQLHAATGTVPADLPARDTLAVPRRDELAGALDELDRPWTGGPFAEPTRRLLRKRQAAIRAMLDRYDELAAAVRASGRPWVLTHGEPHAANWLRTAAGLVLIDWDTVALAPPERDLWHIVRPGDDIDADIDPAGLDLYRLRWSLGEIAEYTAQFRAAHVEDADTRTAWGGLLGYAGGAAAVS
jgi:spectinomycin phosphotransferase